MPVFVKMKKILLILCFLIQNICAFALQTDTIVIHNSETHYLTNKFFLELEDPQNILSPKDIFDNKNFHPISSTFPRFKYSKSVTWLKFTISNRTDQHYLPISISKSIIDEFDIYFLERVIGDNNGRGQMIHLSSKSPQYNSNVLNQGITLVDAEIEPGNTRTFYARIKSNATVVIPIEIHSANQFIQRRSIETMVNGAFIGMFIVMTLYNFMLFLVVGDKSYLYYVVYIIFLGMTQSLPLGLGNYLFTNDTKLINAYITPLIRIFFGFSLLLFAGEFLHFKESLKKYYKLYQLLYVIYTLAFIATIFGVTRIAYSLVTISAMTTSLTLLVLVTMLYIRGFTPAKFFIIGWGLFLITLILSIARNNGFVPYNYFTLNLLIYSAVIELILFSVALADKINFYRRQNTESQLTALTIARENERLITQQNVFLENKVKERTQELIETNQSLSVTIDNLKSAQIQLLETEKMASLGQLTAGVAHEINNPINFVSANVKPLRIDFDELFLLLSKYEDAANNPDKPELLEEANAFNEKIDSGFVKDEILTLLNGIEEGASRTAEIVQSLRTFSRMDELVLVPANINTAILSTLVILRSSIPYYIEIKPILDRLEPLNCYLGKINQVLMNLINNSIQAIKVKPAHNNESITIYTRDYEDHICIEITDTGIGMPESIRQRIFEPFFTTKNVGEGTGLGLSIVFGIIEKHNGTIQVKSEQGIGSTFTIMLPKNLIDVKEDEVS
jgi:two-component system NtrC family sensor kinase